MSRSPGKRQKSLQIHQGQVPVRTRKGLVSMAETPRQTVFKVAGPALASYANRVGCLLFPQAGKGLPSPKLNCQCGHAHGSGPGLWLAPAWLPTPRNSILEARGEKLSSCRPAPAQTQHTHPQEEPILLGRDRLGYEGVIYVIN